MTAETEAGALAAMSPVQGPAQPTEADLMWATGASRAELASPSATFESRQAVLEAEYATYTAAEHLGLADYQPASYAEHARDLDMALEATELEAEL
jgi:hypothetical protein